MKILPVNTYQTTKPNFQSCYRIYSAKSIKNTNCFGKESIRTSTNIFREDLDWFGMIKFMKQHFAPKSKVNIYSLACSDGSEAYTFAISIFENLPTELQSKFLPIYASDIDQEVINTAKTNRINLESVEFYTPEKLFNCQINKYFTDSNVSVMIDGDITSESDTILSYKPVPKLLDAVKFSKSDILTKLNSLDDQGNSVIMCRNVFPYLNETYRDAVIESAKNKLKKGSLFITGDYDSLVDIEKQLLNNGFHQPLLLRSNSIYCDNIFEKT